MSDFVDRFEVQLVDAGRRRAGGRRAPVAWLHGRSARRLVAIVVSIVVPLGAIATTQPWHPLLGNGHSGVPTASVTSPPAVQMQLLGVLRRGQTAADRGDLTQRALRLLSNDVGGVRVGAIRWLHGATSDGPGFALIPVKRDWFIHHSYPGGINVHRLPPSLDGLCLIVAGDASVSHDDANSNCFSTAELLSGMAVIGARGRDGGSVLFGLVPDGVASVTTDVAGRTYTAPVVDNAFVLRTPRGLSPFVTWLGAHRKQVAMTLLIPNYIPDRRVTQAEVRAFLRRAARR